MVAVKKDVLLILYVISIAQVTSRGGIVSPGHCFNLKGVDTKSGACHTVSNVTRKVKKHVSGKDVWRTCDQGPFCRDGSLLMISGAFAVALSWRQIRIRLSFGKYHVCNRIFCTIYDLKLVIKDVLSQD